MGITSTEQEPVLTIGGITLVSLTAFAVAFIGLARAFNVWNVSSEQEAEIIKFIGAMWAIGVPLGVMLRSKVYAPATVQEIKTTLAAEDPNTPLSKPAAEALAK